MADEAIISEEDWYLAQEKRKINSFRREKKIKLLQNRSVKFSHVLIKYTSR